MTDVAAILNAHPRTLPGIDEDALVITVQECLNCAQSCTSCADACIADPSAAHLGRSAGAALNCGFVRWFGRQMFVTLGSTGFSMIRVFASSGPPR
jgi:hypothetical protein